MYKGLNGHFLSKQESMFTYVSILNGDVTLREQSLSMGETGAEGNGQGYEIFFTGHDWGMKPISLFQLGYEIYNTYLSENIIS